MKPTWNYRGLSNQVWSIAKTNKDNNMVDHTGAVYIEKQNWVYVSDPTRCGLSRKQDKKKTWPIL